MVGKLESLKVENDHMLSQKKKIDMEHQTLSEKLAEEELVSSSYMYMYAYPVIICRTVIQENKFSSQNVQLVSYVLYNIKCYLNMYSVVCTCNKHVRHACI